MAQTLFQYLLRGAEPIEFKYTNPARAKIGSCFSLDVMDLREHMFQLREIWEYKRTIEKRELNFVDYVLVAKPLHEEEVHLRVRFMPVEAPDAQLTHHVVVLHKYDEMRFNQDLDDACRCGSGELVITDHDTNTEEKYWRLHDLTESYLARVTVIRDADGSGKVEKDEVESHDVEYWDYARDTLDEAEQKFTQYLFVELDEDTKVQTLWRGEEVDPSRVTVL